MSKTQLSYNKKPTETQIELPLEVGKSSGKLRYPVSVPLKTDFDETFVEKVL